MSIRKRIVKNKRKANGIPSGKTGIVYDVFLKFKDEGKFRSYCKRGFLTETEAQKHELGMKSEFIERAKKKDGYQCLDEYLRQWLSDGKAINRWTLNTFSGYEVNIRKHILPVCGHYRLNEMNPEICDQFLRRMKFQGLSDSSMRYVRRTLCAALNDAYSYGNILNNPVDHTITRFKQSDFTPVLYDLKDLANLMNNAQYGNWECLFLLTGLYGLRRSEALGLKWSYVDFLKREIQIDQQLSIKLVRKQTGNSVLV